MLFKKVLVVQEPSSLFSLQINARFKIFFFLVLMLLLDAVQSITIFRINMIRRIRDTMTRVALNPQRRYKVVFSMHMTSQQILVTKISDNSFEVNKRFLQKTKEKNCRLNNTNFCWPVRLLPGCWQPSAPTCFRSGWSCCCSCRCERSTPSLCRPIHRPTCTRRSGKKQTPSIEHLNK